jgi:hypothetical protein
MNFQKESLVKKYLNWLCSQPIMQLIFSFLPVLLSKDRNIYYPDKFLDFFTFFALTYICLEIIRILFKLPIQKLVIYGVRFAALFLLSINLIYIFNQYADTSGHIVVNGVIAEKNIEIRIRGNRAYTARLDVADELYRSFKPKIEMSKREFDFASSKQQIELTIQPGFFNFPWIEAIKIPSEQ